MTERKPCRRCGHAFGAHMADLEETRRCIAAVWKPGLLPEERAMCGCTEYDEAAEQAVLL